MNRGQIRNMVRLITAIDDPFYVTDAELNLIIEQGNQEVAAQFDWPFLQTSVPISIVAAQQEYALPSDFNYAEGMLDTLYSSVVPYMVASTFFDLRGADTSVQADRFNRFTIWEEELLLFPTPSVSDAARLRFNYYRDPSPLTDDADEPEWDVAFHSVLVEYAKWKLFDREELFDQSERAFVTYTRYLNDMIAFYGKRVKRTPFLYGDGVRLRRGDPNLPNVALRVF